MIKKIVFYPDYSPISGNGHLNRLISFADQVKDTFEIEFIFLLNIIKDFPYKYFVLTKSNTLNEEIESITTRYNETECALVLDGYRFTLEYQMELKEKINIKLIYIDDFAGNQLYADIVINHAPNVNPKLYRVKKEAVLLLGQDYFLLNKDFLNPISYQSTAIKGTVFICFGGVDENDWTKKIVEKILDFSNIRKVEILLGANYTHTREWMRDKKITSYKNLSSKDIVKRMLKAEVVIVPSSTMSLEALVLGKKVLSVKTVDNQELIYRGLKQYEQVETLDLMKVENLREKLNKMINLLLRKPNHRYKNGLQTSLLKSKITSLLKKDSVQHKKNI